MKKVIYSPTSNYRESRGISDRNSSTLIIKILFVMFSFFVVQNGLALIAKENVIS